MQTSRGSCVSQQRALIRLGQILDTAVRYELLEHNPLRGRVTKLKEAEPSRARLRGHEVQAVLAAAGRHRTLLATAIMAGGLRASEVTHLRWRDIDLKSGSLQVTASKTAAGVRIVLEPELIRLLREHKIAAKWSQPEDFVFPGRRRDQPYDRNSLRTRILYGAIKRANAQLAENNEPPLPEKITFHALRRTYAALRAELGEHPAVTPAQMGHRDPRMTLRVYTDVTGVRPRTRLSGLLGDADWAPLGTGGRIQPPAAGRKAVQATQEAGRLQALRGAGATGLEPATSGVTGRRSNQLSYAPRWTGIAEYRAGPATLGESDRPQPWQYSPVLSDSAPSL